MAKPQHTLNSALTKFNDGRTLAYGTMGDEGQPQTQAAVFSRYALYGIPLQQVGTRLWLLGRTWGDISTNLTLENRFDDAFVTDMTTAGHDVEGMPEVFSDTMGHADGIVPPDGLIESPHNPRSNGGVASV